MVHLGCYDETIESKKFCSFLHEMFEKKKMLNDFDKLNDVILLDGARIHVSKYTQTYINQVGCRFIVNNSYSPELNCCEGYILLTKMLVSRALRDGK